MPGFVTRALPQTIPQKSSYRRVEQVRLTPRRSMTDDDCESDISINDVSIRSRRRILLSLPLVLAGGVAQQEPANARGLVQFPCKERMSNTYHIMRAGQSILEENDQWETNPMFLTNRAAALSTTGAEQASEACKKMKAHGVDPSVVVYSIAANSLDTANTIVDEMEVGRNRVLPEYSYMDQRGIGRWNMSPLKSTEDAIWALDADEAGKSGLGGRPPAHEDGTPNETLNDQMIRLRQQLSLLESTFSGDTIVLVFPDGTGPALLTALIGGIPLNRVHELNFNPGELRFDVNYENAWATLPESPSREYLETLDRGRQQLKVLRGRTDESFNENEPSAALSLTEIPDTSYSPPVAMKVPDISTKLPVPDVPVASPPSTTETRRFPAQIPLHAAPLDKSNNDVFRSEKSTSPTIPDFASIFVVGLSAWMATFIVSDDEDMEKTKKQAIEPSLPIKTVELQTQPPDEPQSQTTAPLELQRMEDLVARAPIDIPEFPTSDESSRYAQKQVKEDRFELASKAMQEYIDQDDGEEAWLGFMSDLVSEENSAERKM
eukprot:scaffold7494_cov55-Attheya_sp.AAC.5